MAQWSYYAPAWPGFEQPIQQTRLHQRPRAKPEIRYQTKVVRVRESWHGMSQDRAREWLKDQAQAFCRKYANDQACQRPAVKEQ